MLTSSKALGAAVKGDHVEVKVETKGKEQTISVEIVLVSVGRKPNTEKLGLDAAQVKTNARGYIAIDKQLRTSNPHIFAIGDAAGGDAARAQGVEGGARRRGGDRRAATIGYDVRAMPSAIFTDPEIATVGLSEAEAKKAGHEVQVGDVPVRRARPRGRRPRDRRLREDGRRREERPDPRRRHRGLERPPT